jgi:hypothetical protein
MIYIYANFRLVEFPASSELSLTVFIKFKNSNLAGYGAVLSFRRNLIYQKIQIQMELFLCLKKILIRALAGPEKIFSKNTIKYEIVSE